MGKEQYLNDPWLVAAWPGMGAVAISADYYLMAKLGMHLLAEFPAREFFDLERVEVKDGLILTGRLPRSRLFLWHDPQKRHDLIVFIGEAQPPTKGGAFCSQLIGHAERLGVKRVFTFAAMATQMRPDHESRVFGAAIDRESLADFKRLKLQIVEEGYISGLNGVLLGVAADRGMTGGCLLGEIPSVFSQFPFPKASLAVLKSFTALAGITLDFNELQTQSAQVAQGLTQFLYHLENPGDHPEPPIGAPDLTEPENPARNLAARDKQRVEELFVNAARDRSLAYALKQELDRLKVFHDYEDRFLDLFKEPD
ncbi:PAC2 family protein [bacterium]|nr:PAC2 family protein [bacterium]